MRYVKRLTMSLLLMAAIALTACGMPAPTSAPQESAPTHAALAEPTATAALPTPVTSTPMTSPLTPTATATQLPTETVEPTVMPTPVPQPAFTSLTNLDDVQDLMQTTDGQVWAATTGGVVIWDIKTGEHTALHVEDGLPSNDARALAQTSDGAIWIGTAAGLARYQEGSVVGYLKADVLGSADVQALLVDSVGRLWVGTQGAGVVRYDGETWQPMHFSKSEQANNVYSIYEDAKGTLWFGGMGLARLDGDKWQVLADKAVSGQGILAIAADSTGALWLGTNFGLMRYADARFKEYSFPKRAMNAVNDIWPDADGRLWLGTEKSGAWTLDGTKWHQLTGDNDGLSVTAVRRFLPLSGGGLLVATDQGLYSRADGAWQPYVVGGGPAGNSIRAMLLDKSGVLWVAARGRPLSMYNGESWQEVGQAGKQRPLNILSLAQTTDGAVWAAEAGKGVWRIQGDDAKLVTSRDGLASSEVTGLAADAEGGLWVATQKGLSRWDGDRWQTWSASDGLPSAQLAAVTAGVDAANRSVVWVGAAKDGAARYTGGTWTAFGAADGVPVTRPISMAADGEGVWLGYAQTRQGASRQLAHYDGQAWTLVTAAEGLPAADPLVLLDDQGWLWVGTDGLGLARYADGMWSSWSGADGLADNRVSALVADGKGVLWVGTNAGLSRLDTALLP